MLLGEGLGTTAHCVPNIPLLEVALLDASLVGCVLTIVAWRNTLWSALVLLDNGTAVHIRRSLAGAVAVLVAVALARVADILV